ncbi:MAG: hypothetical protein WBE76_26200 [Terracidiphilus sp.]
MRTIRFLLALLLLAIPAALFGQIGIRVSIGPPALPVYEQPICPGDGYLWTPGYWAYDNSVSDYYWVPGTWVQAPEVGFLWTPGYWGWGEGGYLFNEGYWGESVGFYGGINYGFGYWGGGYGGGRWDHGHFFYNRSVNNIDVVNIHNVYNERVENNNDSRVSFNGGRGGVEARPTSQQEAAARQRHIPAVAAQIEHAQEARANPEQRAAANHGKPVIAATQKPGDFSEHAAASPKETGEASRAGTSGAATDTRAAIHPKDLPPIARPAPANSGNAKADRKYDQQQDKLIAKQTQERQDLQQKQDDEHQQKASANTQKLEQKHQQQTQQLSQRHAAQQQALQSREPQARPQAEPARPR